MKTKLLFLLLLCTCFSMAQDRKNLQGRVMAGGAMVPSVFVINKNTGTEVSTNGQGLFTILARTGDMLVVYSNKTEVREFYISDETFKTMPYVVEVIAKAYDVQEVVVTDTVAIIQPVSRVAAYTPAERRVNAGAKVRPYTLDHMGGGVGIPLDAVANIFSGKKKRLKEALITEQKEKAMQTVTDAYPEEDMVTLLNIPQDEVAAFLFYVMDNNDMMLAIK
ncbi:MAG: hypothetical protein EOP54_24595, partial [Sphingobacteriales bacterium]